MKINHAAAATKHTTRVSTNRSTFPHTNSDTYDPISYTTNEAIDNAARRDAMGSLYSIILGTTGEATYRATAEATKKAAS
jgi:hypothetical protein